MRTALIALLLFCVHCSSQPEPTTPASEAPAAAPSGPTPAAAAESSAPAAPPPAADTAAAKESPAPASGSSKPKCEKLDKTTCKITTGCAWNDKKKCVTEGEQ